ncbi:hypothetical protein BJ875DRAFT_499199 [Amylocarpus encephaloides]|uniref:Uncharacterized protein n=1 Tax=Amylocarpus encephaloides TaxID=45428 RepID=A0A9P8C1Y3_9HELO|nr:hypothetical protein BJ875DRAFT_499199 [Amylocarpus encephaloides]
MLLAPVDPLHATSDNLAITSLLAFALGARLGAQVLWADSVSWFDGLCFLAALWLCFSNRKTVVVL